VIIILLLVVGLVVGLFIVYPQYQERQAAQATVEQVETHYQAGVAFQSVGDWEKAAREYEQVILVKPNYKDAQTRLAEVKAKQAEAQTQATATAMARATEAAVQAQATATAGAQATAVAQAADATATADAVEAHYQKGLAYINLGKWDEAKTELEQVFAVDPNYKEVQAKLTEVKARLEAVQALTPTTTPPVTPSPLATSTPGSPEASIEWVGQTSDQVRPGNEGLTPDGKLDGVFLLTVSAHGKTLVKLELREVDAQGSYLSQFWDTDPKTTCWALGVAEKESDTKLNRSEGSLNLTPEDIPTELKLYAAEASDFVGKFFRVLIYFSDGTGVIATTKVER